MARRFQNPPSLLAPGLLSLLGAAYCLFIYLGLGEAVCVTAGCSLYKSFSIAGISMWIFGLIAFASLVLLLAAGVYSLTTLLARLFLAADCILLLIMASTSPCLSCLGVAILFALIYLLLRNADETQHKTVSVLLFFWSLLFFANLVLSAREMLPPQPIYGETDAPVHIYFSPSCDACVKAINTFKYKDGTVAYFATAHDEEDVSKLLSLRAKINQGMKMPEALNAVLKEPLVLGPIPVNQETLLLRWQLFRNKTTIMQLAGGSVPYITIRGLPTSGSMPEITQGQNLLGTNPKHPHVPASNQDVQSQANASLSSNTLHPQTNSTATMLDNPFGEPNLLNSTEFGLCNDASPENCQ